MRALRAALKSGYTCVCLGRSMRCADPLVMGNGASIRMGNGLLSTSDFQVKKGGLNWHHRASTRNVSRGDMTSPELGTSTTRQAIRWSTLAALCERACILTLVFG